MFPNGVNIIVQKAIPEILRIPVVMPFVVKAPASQGPIGPIGPQGVQGIQGPPGSGATVFNHQITAGEIAASQLTLPTSPAEPSKVTLSIAGGTLQVNGVDFTVSGSIMSWAALGMATVISVGDFISVEY